MSESTSAGGEPDRRLVFQPLADGGLFILVDPDAPMPWPLQTATATDLRRPVVPGESGLGFVSAGRDFFPSVEVRIIHGRPPDPSKEDWDFTGEEAIRVLSGVLSVRSLGGDVAGTFDVDPGLWHAAWRVRGRDEAAARSSELQMFFHGIEEWALDLWPADQD